MTRIAREYFPTRMNVSLKETHNQGKGKSMKKIMALGAVLLMSSAYAQSNYDSTSSDYGTGSSWGSGVDATDSTGMGTGEGSATGGDMHMIESNVDSLVRGAYSFDKSKSRGKSADNDSQLDLVLNYAVKFKDKWQGGVRLNYLKDTDTNGDTEDYGFQVGAIYNFSENLMDSMFVSLFTGLEWNKFYDSANKDDEIWKTTLAFGKRFSLARWNIAHLTYSPELALVTENSTTGSKGSNLEYSQSVQLRFLQFSLFF